jgi:8-oxo-dGTP diphosphatase
MAAFLKEIDKFYGTKEKNRQGEDLETFLEHYDPHKYETPSCTTDAVIFSKTGKLLDVNQLKVLLVRRSNHPNIGFWALPGGFAEMRENLEDTARRELEEETGVKGFPMEQFAVYGDYDRDPRTRVITTAYLSLVEENRQGTMRRMPPGAVLIYREKKVIREFSKEISGSFGSPMRRKNSIPVQRWKRFAERV